MNLDKISFRTTEEQRLYLQEQARNRGIDNPTKLIQTIVEEHKVQNTDSSSKLEIYADNTKSARCRPVVSQKNEDNFSSVDTTFQHEVLSPARADRDRVKPSYKNKQRRRQDLLPMHYREDGTYYVDKNRIQTNSMSTGN